MTKMPDRLLLGTWKSDRRRTFRHWKSRPEVSAANHRKFRLLFGKLTIRWTPKYCYTDFDGDRSRGRYEVVATDFDSIVVRVDAPSWMGEGETKLYHIHFEDDYYWMALTSGFVEWFRRVPSR